MPTSHGIPGSELTYRPRHGRRRLFGTRARIRAESGDDGYGSGTNDDPKLTIRLADPETGGASGGTGLFAHYVWNAGVLGAEMILGLDEDDQADGEGKGPSGAGGEGRGRAMAAVVKPWRQRWEVAGERVLELGAGTSEFFLCCLSSSSGKCQDAVSINLSS